MAGSMAGLKTCPNCGVKNQASNRFCEDCGYDMNKAPVSSFASVSALFCPNGHSVSETGFSMGFCDICGEKLLSEKPEEKPAGLHTDPEPVMPLSPTLILGKEGSACGTINPESGVFCEECGQALVETPSPTTFEDPIEISPSRPDRDTLPDIPDIMRPMTNNDMKR